VYYTWERSEMLLAGKCDRKRKVGSYRENGRIIIKWSFGKFS
jgi:hypothetical protein